MTFSVDEQPEATIEKPRIEKKSEVRLLPNLYIAGKLKFRAHSNALSKGIGSA